MIEPETSYVLKNTGKIVEKVGNSYQTVGLVNEFYDSIEFNDGHLLIYYDSSYNEITDRPAPILNLRLTDDSGNSITWSYDVIRDAQQNTNVRIISGAGNQPPYTFSPYLFDSDLVTSSTEVQVTGTTVNGNPTILDDSGNRLDFPLQLSYSYSNDLFLTSSYSIKDALKFADMGTPAIRYIKSLASSIDLNSNPTGIDYNDSGNFLYVMGDNGDEIKQYGLNSEFDISTAYDTGENSFGIHSYQTGSKKDIDITKDGDRMFILSSGPDGVYQYDLDSPGNVSSAQFKSHFYQHPLLTRDSFLSTDGKYYFVLHNDYKLYRYELYEPYRISSAEREPSQNYTLGNYIDRERVLKFFRTGRNSYIGRYVIFDHLAYPQAFCFSKDGTYLYEITGLGYDEGRLRRFTLTEPWNLESISTSNFILHKIGIGDPSKEAINNSKQNGVWGLRISDDGTKMFLMTREDGNVYRSAKVLQYNFGTPYDLSSLSEPLTYFNTNGTKNLSEIPYEQRVPFYNSSGTIIFYYTINNEWNDYINGFEFDSNGSRFYVSNHQKIFEYTANNFNVGSSSFVKEHEFNDLNTSTKSLNISPNDTYLYIQNSGIVNQYSLNGSMDSNLDYSHTSKFFTIGGEESNPEGVIFTRDGTKMYVTGTGSRNIHEYVLSVPFEVHSAVLNTTLDVSALLSSPRGLTFNPDETIMYVVSANTVYSFNVNDPFDTSTFTGDAFNVTSFVNTLNGIRWNDTGTQFSVVGTSSVGIDTYETKNSFAVKPL